MIFYTGRLWKLSFLSFSLIAFVFIFNNIVNYLLRLPSNHRTYNFLWVS
jgi:hypothetical protein